MIAALAHDPVVDLVVRGALAALFASAALHKLRDVAAFREIVRAYRLAPDAAVTMAPAIAVAEMIVAVSMLLPSLRTAAGLGAVALLALYSAAIGINLHRGRRTIDCGCGALGTRQPISEWLLVRNAVLMIAAVATLHLPAPRAWLWIDWLTVAGGVAVLACVWTAAHGLWAARGLWATGGLAATRGLAATGGLAAAAARRGPVGEF